MKYFEAHAKDSYQDDLDISVHCDVAIFEWLMRYIKNKSDPQLSKFLTLAVKNVISILISSNYLKMERLEEDCIKYVAAHLQDIVKLQIDLSCLTPKIVKQISLNSTVSHINPRSRTSTHCETRRTNFDRNSSRRNSAH